MGFYGGVKAHCWKGGGMGRHNRFISIIVFSQSLEAEIEIETEFRLIAQPYLAV